MITDQQCIAAANSIEKRFNNVILPKARIANEMFKIWAKASSDPLYAYINKSAPGKVNGLVNFFCIISGTVIDIFDGETKRLAQYADGDMSIVSVCGYSTVAYKHMAQLVMGAFEPAVRAEYLMKLNSRLDRMEKELDYIISRNESFVNFINLYYRDLAKAEAEIDGKFLAMFAAIPPKPKRVRITVEWE